MGSFCIIPYNWQEVIILPGMLMNFSTPVPTPLVSHPNLPELSVMDKCF